VLQLLQPLELLFGIEPGVARVAVYRGVVQPLVAGPGHAGDDAPLGAQAEEQLQGRPVLCPYRERIRLLRVFGRGDAQRLGVLGASILYLPAGTRPPPAGIAQFFAAALARPCWASNQLAISGRRT